MPLSVWEVLQMFVDESKKVDSDLSDKAVEHSSNGQKAFYNAAKGAVKIAAGFPVSGSVDLVKGGIKTIQALDEWKYENSDGSEKSGHESWNDFQDSMMSAR